MFEFVADPGNRHIYTLLMNRVRETGRSVNFSFRCDAPDLRRFMQMEIGALSNGGLAFVSRTVREETRKSIALLDSESPRSDELLGICSWCKKVRLDEADEWVEVEDAIKHLNLFESTLLPQLSHGVCPECYESALKAEGV